MPAGNDAFEWPHVKPHGQPLEFVQLDSRPIVHNAGLREEQYNFWHGLRSRYCQFDIIRANGGIRQNESCEKRIHQDEL